MRSILIQYEDSFRGDLLLVTPNHPLPYAADIQALVPAIPRQPQILLQAKAAESLQQVFRHLHCDTQFAAVSGYRTQDEQQHIWENAIAEKGLPFARQFVAIPGHSEHQTGLAIDLAEQKSEIDFICPDFPRTGIFQQFRQIAPRYGWIERYLRGKESITGIAEEPWHFRYVGVPHAEILSKKGMVLEEYIRFLKETTSPQRPFHVCIHEVAYSLFYLPLEREETKQIELSEKINDSVSGTNEGGIVLTLWGPAYAE